MSRHLTPMDWMILGAFWTVIAVCLWSAIYEAITLGRRPRAARATTSEGNHAK